jgi:hypothetical protein
MVSPAVFALDPLTGDNTPPRLYHQDVRHGDELLCIVASRRSGEIWQRGCEDGVCLGAPKVPALFQQRNNSLLAVASWARVRSTNPIFVPLRSFNQAGTQSIAMAGIVSLRLLSPLQRPRDQEPWLRPPQDARHNRNKCQAGA